MKKLLSLCLVVLIFCALLMPTVSAYGEPELTTEDGFVYSVVDGGVIIKGYTAKESQVVIPSEIDGFSVKTIDSKSFSDKKFITSVVIPDTITVIDSMAFDGCTSLKDVNLPENLEKLGAAAFGNTALESVCIPSALKTARKLNGYCTFNGIQYRLEGGPFFGCESLCEVTFEEGTDTVVNDLMAGCIGLKKVTFPESIVSVGARSFSSCLNLEEIMIPAGITLVGDAAFSSCVSLEKIDFKNADTEIGESVFANCDSLKSLSFPENLKTIPYRTFAGCVSLEKAVFSEGLEVIGWGAFRGCESLVEIQISKTITTIENFAFSHCSSLESVYFPESVKTLGPYVFEDCEALKSVQFADYGVTVIPKEAFKNCFELESVILPEGLLEIQYSAFANNYKLKDIVIPQTVTTIAEDAFVLDKVTGEEEVFELTIDETGDFDIKFAWKQVEGAEYYTLDVKNKDGEGSFTVNSKKPWYYWDGMDYAGVYTATVRAYDSEKELLSTPECKDFRLEPFGMYDWGGIIGDVRGDFDVDIRDATHIQRYLAGIAEINRFTRKHFADVDNDSEVTIKDVTAIQKYCAGIVDDSLRIGEETGGGGIIWRAEDFYE